MTKGDLLMFMAQNASVETVTARTHKTVENDFMLRVWRGYIVAKERASVRDRGSKGMVMGLPSANTRGISGTDETLGGEVDLRRERVWSVTWALQSRTASSGRMLKRGPWSSVCTRLFASNAVIISVDGCP